MREWWGEHWGDAFWTLVAILGVLTMAVAGEGPKTAGESSKPGYVHLASDCLIYTFKGEFVSAVGAVPDGVALADGGRRYTLELQVGERFYQFCWSDRAQRDDALQRVERALGVGGP